MQHYDWLITITFSILHLKMSSRLLCASKKFLVKTVRQFLFAKKMSAPLKTIHDLPPEMLEEIFSYLCLITPVELKLVCKLWNELISRMKLHSLFVDNDLDSREKWFHSNRPCRQSELCTPVVFYSRHKHPTLVNLRCLRLDNSIGHHPTYFDFNELNMFEQLVQLEIHCDWTKDLDLHLPNLEILLLVKNQLARKVNLDCKKLAALSYSNHGNSLFVQHPDTIRMLDSNMVGTKLIQFKNLEWLRCANKNLTIDDSTLQTLRKLEVAAHTDYKGRDFRELIEALRSLIQRKRRLGGSDLVIYLAGLQVITEDDLSEIEFDFGLGSNLIWSEKLHMKHYDRLQVRMEFVQDVDYNQLVDSIDVLPDDYFSRFSNLREVTAYCPLNEQHFSEFLRKVYSLQKLALYFSPDLSQSFFDSLPEFCSLFYFYLLRPREWYSGENNERHVIKLDFKFIGRFKKMKFLGIYEKLSRRSSNSIFSAIDKIKLEHYHLTRE